MNDVKKSGMPTIDELKEMINHQDQSKPKSLEQLESDLDYFELFIQKCINAVPDDFSCAFTLDDKSVSYEDIQRLSLDERYSITKKLIETNSEFNDTQIHLAVRILYVMGFKDLARAVHVLNVDYGITKYYQPKIDDIKTKIKHKKITGKGGKGKTSPYKIEALRIAADTWEKIPDASRASLAGKIHDYLKGKHRGVPVTGTIEDWLKKSGLDPKIEPKLTGEHYDLVINKH